MQKKTVRDEDVSGKRVLVRVDFNVPMDQSGTIEDDTRIRACLPTITYLIDHQARVILCSHLGRPHGRVDEHLRLGPVGRRLSELVQRPVEVLREAVGPGVVRAVSEMQDGDLVLLENLRFYPGEEENDPVFARALASLADLFVNDAFGASHRAHASVVGLAAHLPCVAGLLMEKEIEQMSGLLEDPARPFAAVMGGAKVGEKIGILKNILPKVDLVLVGGGMAATFLKGRGVDVGISPVESDRMALIGTIMQEAETLGARVLLPEDLVVAGSLEAGANARVVSAGQIPADCMIADIGPLTIAAFTKELETCRTVAWNGPMGVFEIPQFSNGTTSIAQVLAGLNATTVIGGGSTAEAVTQLGLAGRMTHVSTGGGASLQFLSGKVLPGIAVLADRETHH
ncbi:phosphoglycerate kinase [Methanosphaerula palustris]|uniref:Phosphoglycerate kinase n=1 Tax=Methanosphaerula palustris (strain ATCC BAA-1556 / DSM 19958 / E1-9c) TaxID=521011 RepID=B8GI16_METPE|nr:phosphoglycerate kinase [Methanosphaerula palustris]ACL16756.1 Phosphoglycerate kinase [Methanosphaerula palustris E1-9c]